MDQQQSVLHFGLDWAERFYYQGAAALEGRERPP